jgi:serine/threonine protein phosphatase PrpC
MPLTLKALSSCATSVGFRHRLNEDAFLADDSRRLYIVSDGLGGHQGGAAASHLVVEAVSEALARPPAQRDSVTRSLHEAVSYAAKRVDRSSAEHDELTGMGATLTALVLVGEERFLAHVGDSRAYLVRGKKIEALTRDHSVAYELFERGLITRGELAHHPAQRMLTRAVGAGSDPVVPDVSMAPLARGDLFLLCSDGLTKALSERRILAHALSRPTTELAPALVDAATAAGAEDDVTVVAVSVA